jgi:hypothetical protein
MADSLSKVAVAFMGDGCQLTLELPERALGWAKEFYAQWWIKLWRITAL